MLVDRTRFLVFCRYLRILNPPNVRIAIVLGNFSPHLSTEVDRRVGRWAEVNQRGVSLRTDQRQLDEPGSRCSSRRCATLDGPISAHTRSRTR